VPAPGTAAEQPTHDAVDDDDGTFVRKMKGATFQRRLPRFVDLIFLHLSC